VTIDGGMTMRIVLQVWMQYGQDAETKTSFHEWRELGVFIYESTNFSDRIR
jgi:hypothetical protein